MIVIFIVSSKVIEVEVGDKYHADIFRLYAELLHVDDKGRGIFFSLYPVSMRMIVPSALIR